MPVVSPARTRNAVTEQFLAALAGSETGAESRRITEALDAALGVTGGGLLDSHAAADAVFEARCADADRPQVPSWEQTRDYVQHLLRESDHVCRHADGHHYRLHEAKRCSADCDSRYGHLTTVVRSAGNCPDCNLRLPASGQCGLCD